MVIATIEQKLLDLFFPKLCVQCKREGDWICALCEQEIVIDTEMFELENCQVQSLFKFENGAVRELLHNLKYNGIGDISEILVSIANRRGVLGKVDYPKRAVVVPVPTSRAHLKMRGYNQAEELARAVARYLGLSVDSSFLKRAEGGRSQVGKTVSERELQKGTFTVVPNSLPQQVLLLDDVCTTGNTLKECIQSLKNAGISEIYAMVIARKQFV